MADRLVIRGKPLEYQARHKLEPVGIDWTGEVKNMADEIQPVTVPQMAPHLPGARAGQKAEPVPHVTGKADKAPAAKGKGKKATTEAPAVRVGDIVHFVPGDQHAQYQGQLLAAIVCKVLESGRVNLNVFHPQTCGGFYRGNVEHNDGSDMGESWQAIE
jgi:hypothetical protein